MMESIESGDVTSPPKVSSDCRQEKSDVESSDALSKDSVNGESSPQGTEVIPSSVPKETVEFKIVYNKQRHDVTFPLDDTISTLKQHIQKLTGLPPAMQKVMYKGLAKDERTLREVGVVQGVKVMVVGSTMNDVLSVNTPTSTNTKDEVAEGGPSNEPLCQQKMHKKVLDKGLPEDAMPGIKNVKEPLPPVPIFGMLNKSGDKVRLTFKLEVDEVWIGTKERTNKIRMSSIKTVTSEPIEGHEQYHIMALQLGPTEASRYWFYWVPAQYTDAIKDAVLGKWQFF